MLVFIQGAYLRGNNSLNSSFLTELTSIVKKKDRIVLELNAIGSLHVRACQMFYKLIGGKTNYGIREGKKNKQFGVTEYEGEYTEWSEDNPIDLIGFSFGGIACRYLQYLLEEDYFNKGTNANWIKSITCISTSHKGSFLANLIEMYDQNGDIIENGYFNNFLQYSLLSDPRFILKYLFDNNLDSSFFYTNLEKYLNLINYPTDSFDIRYENMKGEDFLKQYIKNKDNYMYDYLPKIMTKILNEKLRLYSNTKYINIMSGIEAIHQIPLREYDLTTRTQTCSFLSNEEKEKCLENDGISCTYSQKISDIEDAVELKLTQFMELDDIEKGKWTEIEKFNCDHIGTIMHSIATGIQYNIDEKLYDFYPKLFNLLGYETNEVKKAEKNIFLENFSKSMKNANIYTTHILPFSYKN